MFGYSYLMSSVSNFHCSRFNSEIVEGNETVAGSITSLISLSIFTSSSTWVLVISKDYP
jgi:hypothetical protein